MRVSITGVDWEKTYVVLHTIDGRTVRQGPKNAAAFAETFRTACLTEFMFRRVSVKWVPELEPENAKPLFGGIVWGPTVCSFTPGALAYLDALLVKPDHVVERSDDPSRSD